MIISIAIKIIQNSNVLIVGGNFIFLVNTHEKMLKTKNAPLIFEIFIKKTIIPF